MQPTLKLEMFAPPAQPQPQRPFGIYDQLIPKIEMGDKKFLPGVYQQLFNPTSAISYGPNVRMPVQQVYNINLPGPTGGHVEMSKIYDIVMPKGKDGKKMSSTTLGERLQIYDYLRQILIKSSDGEEISLDDDGQNSIMSYIKFMELNPNYYNPIQCNPYKGLPFGLLIYRACAGINLDEKSQTVVCNRDSEALNIRLYSLTYAEYFSYEFRQMTYKEYDVWRELAYYEYVREKILKQRQSPNFPLLYGWGRSCNRKIDFFSLKKKSLTQKDFLTKDWAKFVQVHTLFSKVKPSNELIKPMSLPDAARKVIAKLPDEIDPSLQAYSGTTLILITEAPHHNLYQWASRKYQQNGIVKKMISHGYHGEKIWLGILFQIVSALYVMQLHGIYMRDMTVEDNIYIKDLQNFGKAMGYWMYVINGIKYYIPNYGYLVMVDSNFKDIIPKGTTIDRCDREYKIYTHDIIGKSYSMENIRKQVYENYKRIVNTNSFTKEHTKNDVTKPPETVMKLIQTMMEDQEMDLGIVISRYFRPLMNNRIGTLLRKDTEVPNIRDITGQFKKGELAVEVVEEDLYKWCLILAPKGDGVVRIVTKEDPTSSDYVEKDVRIETIKQYSTSATIDQNTNPEVNLSEDDMLETYIVSNH